APHERDHRPCGARLCRMKFLVSADMVGAHASPDGPFTLIKMAAPFPEVAHIESPAGSIYLETDAVDRFVDTYDWLEQHSLSGEESNALLADLEKEFQ